MRVETRKSIYMLGFCRWRWWPDIDIDWSNWSAVLWLCLQFQRIDKEWMSFCEDHGFGMADAMQFVEGMLLEELSHNSGRMHPGVTEWQECADHSEED